MFASLLKWLTIRLAVWRGAITEDIAKAEGYEPAWFKKYQWLNEGVGGAIEAAVCIGLCRLVGHPNAGVTLFTAQSLVYERWLDHWGWNLGDVAWRQVGASLFAALIL